MHSHTLKEENGSETNGCRVQGHLSVSLSAMNTLEMLFMEDLASFSFPI